MVSYLPNLNLRGPLFNSSLGDRTIIQSSSLITEACHKSKANNKWHKNIVKLRNFIRESSFKPTVIESKKTLIVDSPLIRIPKVQKTTKRSVDLIIMRSDNIWKKLSDYKISNKYQPFVSFYDTPDVARKAPPLKKSVSSKTLEDFSKIDNKLARRSSILVAGTARDLKGNGRFQNDVVSGKSFRFIENPNTMYLRKILSSLVIKSVFFKYFYSLFIKFKNYNTKLYRYRSKSENKTDNTLSKRKLYYIQLCLFPEYISNIWAKYVWLQYSRRKYTELSRKRINYYGEAQSFPLFKYLENRVPNEITFGIKDEQTTIFENNLRLFSESIKSFNSSGQLQTSPKRVRKFTNKLENAKVITNRS